MHHPSIMQNGISALKFSVPTIHILLPSPKPVATTDLLTSLRMLFPECHMISLYGICSIQYMYTAYVVFLD